ncbi:MAG: OmpA family protein [Mariprofundaceae bacterium]
MMNKLLFPALLLLLSGCVGTLPMDYSELSAAKAAISAARAADAERCAPDELSDAQAALYHAAHELSEGNVHPDEQAGLIETAKKRAEDALAVSAKNCRPEIIELPGVNFANDSSEITAASAVILDGAVKTLNRKSNIKVEVAAHTDSVGSDAYNQGLSQRRASSVLNYLVSKGISSDRLVSKGYGESDPIADNATEKGRAKNRRVELRILSK